jgi:hypothetical protein
MGKLCESAPQFVSHAHEQSSAPGWGVFAGFGENPVGAELMLAFSKVTQNYISH